MTVAAASPKTAGADALLPWSHPFTGHLRHTAAVAATQPHQLWTPDDGPLPSLYVSHGAPPLLLDSGWMRQLHDWARSMPRPKAVLIVSAHWESDALGITSTRPTELVYDFGGFDPLFYSMRYDTPESSDLARLLASVMPDSDPIHEHRSRGLDHGAWVPLKAMYPEADIPVLQLSLPTTSNTTRLLDIGSRLRSLREQGVLVIGSGFMTHGLRYVDFARPDHIPGWSADFDAWAADALARGDVGEVEAYRSRAPGLNYAHPTVEHFVPIFVTLGAATDPTAGVDNVIDGYMMGLSKRSFQAA